ncbi:hypothetical protein D3C78_787700 [compost metagenome]
MVEVAEKLIETVVGRQVFVAVTQVVLAELAGGITLRLQRLSDSYITVLQAHRHARHAHLGQPGAQRRLAGNEARPAGGAAVLCVIVGKHHAFFTDAVDVRRLVTDYPFAIGADVGLADVVTEYHQDVGFFRGIGRTHAHRRCGG